MAGLRLGGHFLALGLGGPLALGLGGGGGGERAAGVDRVPPASTWNRFQFCAICHQEEIQKWGGGGGNGHFLLDDIPLNFIICSPADAGGVEGSLSSNESNREEEV